MNFIQYLTESFDSKPAKWRWSKKEVYSPKKRLSTGGVRYFEDRLIYGQAQFTIDSNRYEMTARDEYDGYLDISFTLVRGDDLNDGDDGMTNTGNQFKVFATVIDFAKTVIREFNPPKVSIAAVKASSVDLSKASKAREKVYLRLIKRTINQIEGRWNVNQSLDTIHDHEGTHTVALFEMVNLDHEFRLKEGSK